jgi:hypothetical protein
MPYGDREADKSQVEQAIDTAKEGRRSNSSCRRPGRTWPQQGMPQPWLPDLDPPQAAKPSKAGR